MVALAYYLGAQLGFVLRFPPATPSVLWPPNSILTAALLLAPPRRWWLYLLAALPAHLAAELPMGWPISLVLALFATNCTEALVAAVGLRLTSDAPTRFDSLRRVTAFIVAVVGLATFLSSFLDAGVVAWLGGESYWTVFRTRLFSNILAAVTLVPTVVAIGRTRGAWVRYAPAQRRAEGALLALGLAASCVLVFFSPLRGPEGVLARHTPMALLLPFLLWASVRFGAAALSASLLLTAVLAIGAGTQGLGPYSALPPGESVLDLQLFLSALGIPLLYLAGASQESRRVRRAVERRLQFEEILSRLSASLVHVPSQRLKATLEPALRRVGMALGLDRVCLFELSPGTETLTLTCHWVSPDVTPPPPALARQDFPWLLDQVLRDRTIVYSQGEDLPLGAERERALFRQQGVRSQVTVPLVAGERVLGSMCFGSFSSDLRWAPQALQQLRLVAEICGSALARIAQDEAVRAAELEAQRVHQELARFSRAASMGEMSAALAHQLNQPLAGLLTNAQAGRRMLEASPLDLPELRALLDDIVADVKRAAEVIRGLRKLLRKGEAELRPVELTGLVRDVTHLVASDVVSRNVSLTLDLPGAPQVVTGDPIQLQQVVLNLLVNAMEAMAGLPVADRAVTVRVGVEDSQVHCAVADRGGGLETAAVDRLFEPFYTTKRGGMGMGLSVARSIVEAHGGSIWAESNPERGATFHFTLPLTGQPT